MSDAEVVAAVAAVREYLCEQEVHEIVLRERAAIVAWLRKRVFRANYGGEYIDADDLAAIERGDHYGDEP